MCTAGALSAACYALRCLTPCTLKSRVGGAVPSAGKSASFEHGISDSGEQSRCLSMGCCVPHGSAPTRIASPSAAASAPEGLPTLRVVVSGRSS